MFFRDLDSKKLGVLIGFKGSRWATCLTACASVACQSRITLPFTFQHVSVVSVNYLNQDVAVNFRLS